MTSRIMFEIYRDTLFQGGYRVVYFTELDDHSKEGEISRAMAGEHLYDGFIEDGQRAAAKLAIADLLEGLNSGAVLSAADVDLALKPFVSR